jgi:hypothetical protein
MTKDAFLKSNILIIHQQICSCHQFPGYVTSNRRHISQTGLCTKKGLQRKLQTCMLLNVSVGYLPFVFIQKNLGG